MRNKRAKPSDEKRLAAHWNGLACREKKSLYAKEQEREDVKEKRRVFEEHIKHIPKEDLLFLDESGCRAHLTHLYGYGKMGQHLRLAQVQNRGKNVTRIGVLGIQGLCAFQTFEGSMNRERFVSFLRDVLLPQIPKGNVLVMDNLRAHHGPIVREIIHSFGCSLLYLPPYCPQDNPIELCWSQTKHSLRS